MLCCLGVARKTAGSFSVHGNGTTSAMRGRARSSVRSSLISAFTAYDCFASWAVQGGATLQEVKDLLGQHSLAMVLRYSHLSPEHLRSAVARLDAFLPASDSTQDATQEPVE